MSLDHYSQKNLFLFYKDTVKQAYAAISAQNQLPAEVLFEIHAAFDHLSRIYTYDEPEVTAVKKAYGHLKRATFDIFKLFVKEHTDQWLDLRNKNLDYIDNGKFKHSVISLHYEIIDLAKKARSCEGEDTDRAFENWIEVYAKCQKFTDEYYSSEKVEWADITYKKEKFTDILRKFFLWFISMIISGNIGAYIGTFL